MLKSGKQRFVASVIGTALTAFLAMAAYFFGAPLLRPAPVRAAAQQQTTPPSSAEEIPAAQTIQPDELAKEIASKDKPIVACVAPRFLYDGAHIPGALFHGPTSRPEGLDDLRKWAKDTPRDANIVLYCGCCPFVKCPNVRPAFAALRQMGFTHVKVLSIPTNFNTDWIEKGYPVEKGQ